MCLTGRKAEGSEKEQVVDHPDTLLSTILSCGYDNPNNNVRATTATPTGYSNHTDPSYSIELANASG